MIELKYFGHSTFLVQIESISFISPNSLASDIEFDIISTQCVNQFWSKGPCFDFGKIVNHDKAIWVSSFGAFTRFSKWY